MSWTLSLTNIQRDEYVEGKLFRDRDAKGSWVNDEEPVTCEVDTYMQIAKLNKIYLPPSKAFNCVDFFGESETIDPGELMEKRST